MKEVTRMYFRCVIIKLWILLYILLLNIKYYINVNTLKNYAVMLRLLSDIIPMLILHYWRTFRLLSTVLSGWISILTVKVYWCHLFHESIALAQLVVHVCWLCSVCHVVYPMRFLFVVVCWGWLLYIISALYWFCFWYIYIYIYMVVLFQFRRYTDLYLRCIRVWLTSRL